MAIENEILVGRFNRLLQKLFSMKGHAPAPQLSSDIQFDIALNLGVETRYLESWDRFGQGLFIAGVAANTSGARLRNPAGSNVIGVVEKLTVSTQALTGPVVRHGTATADLATLAAPFRFDARSRSGSTLILSSQNTAAALPGLASTQDVINLNLLANTNYDLVQTDNQEIPLLPGDAIQVDANAVNAELSVAFWWRERFLEESERT